MSEQENASDQSKIEIKSGPEIVSDFMNSLQAEKTLDQPTVSAIQELQTGQKLTVNSLLKRLEELRGGSKV